MDNEQAMMAARSAKMEELRQVKEVLRNSSTEIAGIVQDQQALARWLDLGGSEETFGQIDSRHFASMPADVQQAFVRGFKVMADGK